MEVTGGFADAKLGLKQAYPTSIKTTKLKSMMEFFLKVNIFLITVLSFNTIIDWKDDVVNGWEVTLMADNVSTNVRQA